MINLRQAWAVLPAAMKKELSKKRAKRISAILSLLQERQKVSVEEFSQELGVTKVTIRRDLADLEAEGKLIRKFGGATLIGALDFNGDDHHRNTKLMIARAAAALIQDGSRIIIDAGTTTGEILNFIDQKEKLAIMTNSLQIGWRLAQVPLRNRPKIILTGGTYDHSSDTFQGIIVKEVLKNYNFEQLFIGADGIDFELGTMTINEGSNYSEVMADISREVIVLIESHKIGRKMPKLELPWSKIHTIITDHQIHPSDLKSLKQTGVNVIVAQPQQYKS